MLTVCWAVKGGSGTSTVTALLALSAHRPVTLVDLDGDLPLIFGLPPSDRPGITEWSTSEAAVDHLDDLLLDVAPDLHLLPAAAAGARRGALDDLRLRDLVGWCRDRADRTQGDVIVDAGTGPLAPGLHEAADRTVLITRNCYLALQRARAIAPRPSTVVLVREAAVGLGPGDVESSVGAPVGAELTVDPRLARTVNAGLLGARCRRLSLAHDGS